MRWSVYSQSIDRRPVWKKERGRMLTFIVDSKMKQMSEEEIKSRARGSIHESLFYAPDYELISKYEAAGGKWTEVMLDKYRVSKPKSKQ